VDRPVHFATVLRLFYEQFPERYNPETGPQAFSSIYYRDNDRPALDANNRWFKTSKGDVAMVSCKVRSWSTTEGKELDFPTTLVDKWPERVLCERYKRWKSPILEEDRAKAREILEGRDREDRVGSKFSFLFVVALSVLMCDRTCRLAQHPEGGRALAVPR
jgi:hypothetical protein